jgi:zinc protease
MGPNSNSPSESSAPEQGTTASPSTRWRQRVLVVLSLLVLPACSMTRDRIGELPIPEAGTFRLSNGVEVWHVPSNRVPMINLSLVIGAGSSADPPGKAGLAALTLSMLEEGAGERDSLAFADEIDFLGAAFSASADRDYSTVQLEALRRNFDAALDLMADAVVRPRLEEKEWQRVKALWLNNLRLQSEQPGQIARRAGDRLFYGAGHPYAEAVDGRVDNVEGLTLKDVVAFNRTFVRPERAIFVCVGDLTEDELRVRLESRFGAWKGDAPEPGPIQFPQPEQLKDGQGLRIAVVNRPAAPQTIIRVQLGAPSVFDERRPPLVLANLAFGGSITSRLSTNLRKEHEYTYSAGSGLAPRFGPSYLVAQSAVIAEKTGPALREICKELRRMSSTETLTPQEFQKARSTHGVRLMKALQTQQAVLGFLVESAAGGQTPGERRGYHARVQAQTVKTVHAESMRIFRWDRALVTLVGDQELIEQHLAALRTAGEGALDLPSAEIIAR